MAIDAVGRFLAGAPPRPNASAGWEEFWDLARRVVARRHLGPDRPKARAVQAVLKRLPLLWLRPDDVLSADAAMALAEALEVAGLAPPPDAGRSFVTARAERCGLLVRHGPGFALRSEGAVSHPQVAATPPPGGPVCFAAGVAFPLSPLPLAVAEPVDVGTLVAELRDGSFVQALLRVPDRGQTAVGLASDPEGVARAEALALEFAERARLWDPWVGLGGAEATWGAPPPLRAVAWGAGWFEFGSPAAEVIHRCLFWSGGDPSLGRRHRQDHFEAECKARGLALPYSGHPITEALLWAWRWRRGVEEGVTVTWTYGERPGFASPPPPEIEGVRLGDLPDPHGPLLEVLALGYGLRAQEGGCVRLMMPA